MKPAPFGYLRPASVDEAVEALEDWDARPIAGGQSLMALLAMRLSRPSVLVDLNGIPELSRVRFVDGQLEVGAVVRQREAEHSAAIREAVPLLGLCVPFIGHREIRNRGTIVGSVAHVDPAAELPAVAAALQAVAVVRGPAGERLLPAEDVPAGPFQNSLEQGEIITALRFPTAGPGDGYAFEEVARRYGDFAVCGVAVHVRRDGERLLVARVGLLGVASRPVVLDVGAALAADGGEGREALARVGTELTGVLTPTGDLHGSAAYRLHLARVLVARCLGRAWDDAGERRAPVRPGSTVVAPDGGRADGDPPASSWRVEAPPAEAPMSLSVNGLPVRVTVPARSSLADVLRDRLRLTGTHLGCEHGVCGACTVLLDGRAVRSCLLLGVQAEGREVTTVEALGTPEHLHPLQEAFRRHHALQCGFCTPGFLLSAFELLRDQPEVAAEGRMALARELSGVLCRCTGYRGILDAVTEVAAEHGRALPGPGNLGGRLPPGARATAGPRTTA